MSNSEWIKQEPYIDDTGYYTPVNAYALAGTASAYKLAISKEHFIECYTKWIKDDCETTLPDLDEYIDQNNHQLKFPDKSEPRFKCPKCGGNVRKVLGVALLTYPAKYRYECDDCEYSTTLSIK